MTNGLRPAPSNQNRIAISLFVSLLTKKISSVTANQNAHFQPIRTVLFGPIRMYTFGYLICIERNQSGSSAKTFSIQARHSFFLSEECTFSFLQRLCLLGLRTVDLSTVSPFPTPHTGDSCWHWVDGRELLLTVSSLMSFLNLFLCRCKSQEKV